MLNTYAGDNTLRTVCVLPKPDAQRPVQYVLDQHKDSRRALVMADNAYELERGRIMQEESGPELGGDLAMV